MTYPNLKIEETTLLKFTTKVDEIKESRDKREKPDYEKTKNL